MSEYIYKAKTGSLKAREKLVETLRPRIASMASYYGRKCGEDADDLLQEAWIGILEALPNLDLTIGSPEQHLILRAKWKLLDAVRREKVRRCTSLDALNLEFEEERIPAPDQAVESLEFLNTLPPLRRKVLKYLMEGLTLREIGKALGCSSANIAYHVKSIRASYESWQVKEF